MHAACSPHHHLSFNGVAFVCVVFPWRKSRASVTGSGPTFFSEPRVRLLTIRSSKLACERLDRSNLCRHNSKQHTRPDRLPTTHPTLNAMSSTLQHEKTKVRRRAAIASVIGTESWP